MNENQEKEEVFRLLSFARPSKPNLDVDRGGPQDGGMPPIDPEIAVLKYRADHSDQRIDRVDAKLDSIAAVLSDVRTAIAALPTRDQMKSQAMWTMGTVVGAMLALIGLFLAATGSMMGAFQTGIAARPPDAAAPASVSPARVAPASPSIQPSTTPTRP